MARRKAVIAAPTLVMHQGKWHVSYTHPVKGSTYRKSCGTTDRAVAELKMQAIVTGLLTSPAPAGATYTLGDLMDAYGQQRGGKRDANYYALKPLRLFFTGFKLHQLNDAAWSQYRAWRTRQLNAGATAKQGKSPPKSISDATACKELNVLRAALTWGRRNGWTGLENVKVHIPDEPHNAVNEFLSPQEVYRLVEACVEPHLRLFVLLAVATGARMSAILELKWSDVIWPIGGKAPVTDGAALNAVVLWETDDDCDFEVEMKGLLRLNLGQGRGNKRRGTGIIGRGNGLLYQALKDAYDNRKCDFVIEWRGGRVGKVNLEPAYRRAGLTGYNRRQHILKHTCCSWLVQSGASYEAVAKLIGTRAAVIEKHYGQLSPEHLATVGDVLTVRRV